MTEETLREKVARAIYEHDLKDWEIDHTRPAWENLQAHDEWDLGQQDYLGEADAALAALGLDDLDAAVERVMVALVNELPEMGSVSSREAKSDPPSSPHHHP